MSFKSIETRPYKAPVGSPFEDEKPGMAGDEVDGIAGVVEHRFLRFLREHFDIQLFSCPAEENIAHRESA